MSVTFSVKTDTTPGYSAEERPWANFHNAGADAVLALLGLPEEPWGFLANKAIPAVRRSIVRLLSVDRARQAAVRPAEARGRFYIPAQTDERFQARLRELDAVLAFAQKVGGHVVWS